MVFKPTFLYIKQHSITKKCYFGKTIKKDPVKYLGSGTYWLHHIKIHGREFVETLWYKLFTSEEELTRIATLFSEQQDIINSELWLNLIPENGLDGGPVGYKQSPESRTKKSVQMIGKKNALGHKDTLETKAKKIGNKNARGHTFAPTYEYCVKMSVIMMGNKRALNCKHTIEQCAKKSERQRGKSQPKIVCPHCNKQGGKGNMKRWHFDNCKYNGIINV